MITASEFIDRIETQYDVAIVSHHGRLHVLDGHKLSRHDRQLVAAHRTEILRALDGDDRPLRPIVTRSRFAALGFGRLENGLWTHPAGDDYADDVIAGLVAFDDAESEARATEEKSRRMVADRAQWARDRV